MAILSDHERHTGNAIAALAAESPFLPSRREAEKTILDAVIADPGPIWSSVDPTPGETSGSAQVVAVAGWWAHEIRARLLRTPGAATADELHLYEGVATFVLMERHRDAFRDAITATDAGGTPDWRAIYAAFAGDAEFHLELPAIRLPAGHATNHLFACGHQMARTLHHIHRLLPGGSSPLRALRAAVWRTVFGRDLRRYAATLHARIPAVRTLISGAPGTGRIGAARAVGLSGYVPYDAGAGNFVENPEAKFHTVSLEGLPDLEALSELFGHQKESFAGAQRGRSGRIQSAGARGTVFLRGLGQLSSAVQARLSAVLEAGSFIRLGGVRNHRIEARLIASVGRDPAGLIASGRLRADLHRQFAENTIRTPSLRERLADDPGEIEDLVRGLAGRLAPGDAAALTEEVVTVVAKELGSAYAWPGNLVELAQCVRSVLVTGTYRPLPASGVESLDDALRESGMTADEVARRHVTVVYAEAGTYEETARRLSLDRRTVKKRLDETYLRAL